MLDLDKVAQDVRKVVKNVQGNAEVRPEDREEFVHRDSKGSVEGGWEGPGIPPGEFQPDYRTKGEKGESYDLWADLNALKADIMFGQLLEISPIARKTLKEGMPMVRRKKKVRTRIAARARLPGGPSDVKAVEIEATIVDKVVSNVLVDGGSGLNILPAQTMEKLGLSLTGPCGNTQTPTLSGLAFLSA